MTGGIADIVPKTGGADVAGGEGNTIERTGVVDRLRQIATVARSEYRLAVRNRWAFALAGLFAVFGLMLMTFSGSKVGPEGAKRMIASLTNLSVYLVPLAALAFGYDALVGRDRRGWLELVFSLPVSRARVVPGAFLGRAVVLVGAVVIGFGVVGAVTLQEYGVRHWGAYTAFVGGAAAVAVVFLALSFFISAIAAQKTHALGLALLVWVWFVLVHDLMALAAVSAFELSEGVLTAFVVANPASLFRVFVLEQLGSTAGGGFAAAFAGMGLSQVMVLGAMALWCVVAVTAASLVVGRRRIWSSRLHSLFAKITATGLVVIALGGAVGCDAKHTGEQVVETEPVTVNDDESCEVCGMFIVKGEGAWGPNAQVFYDDQPLHFDSVREMFYHLAGEQRRGNEPYAVYVTDYSRADIDTEQRRGDTYIQGSIGPETFVEVTEAVFIVESGVLGAMGPELLPFSTLEDAESFAGAHGGRVVEYDEVDVELIESL